MQTFHISEVLSVTTGRLVAHNHMDGIYQILNFLTGDDLFTHQLPRAMRECEPWLRTQFPTLMKDAPRIKELLSALDEQLSGVEQQDQRATVIANWAAGIQAELALPDMIPVYEMAEEMHTRIDPIEELRAMVGDDRVIVVDATEECE